MEGLLLKNCRFVVTQNPSREILSNMDIMIENDKITKIEKNISFSGEIIDCSGKIAMPALFNGHTHSAMNLLRGYKDDQELHGWLNDIWKVEAKLKPSDMRIGSLYACMEMVKTGTYCFTDMYFEMEEVAKSCNEVGLNAFLGYGMLDLSDEEKRQREIEKTKSFVECLSGRYPGIMPILAPHAIYTCSSNILEWVRDYAKEHNIFKSIHISETEKEVLDSIESMNLRPVEYLDSLGFLNNKTTIFHASWMNEQEIKILAKRNVSAVHCPTSNMKLATGGAFPLREYIENGVNICLGTDGASSNNSLDMFMEMKFAALLQKWHRKEATAANAQEIFDMATLNPARAFDLNSGSIEKGKLANIALLDAKHYSLGPLRNILSNIVYSSTGDAVSDVFVSGKLILKEKKLVNCDEEKIRSDFEEAANRLY